MAELGTEETLGLYKSLTPDLLVCLFFLFVSPYTVGPLQWSLSIIEWPALVVWDKEPEAFREGALPETLILVRGAEREECVRNQRIVFIHH